MGIGLETIFLLQLVNDAETLPPVREIVTNTWLGLQETRNGTTVVLSRVESIIERAQDSIRMCRHFRASHIVLRLGQSLENDLASILNAEI